MRDSRGRRVYIGDRVTFELFGKQVSGRVSQAEDGMLYVDVEDWRPGDPSYYEILARHVELIK